jgi:hypothetical protein
MASYLYEAVANEHANFPAEGKRAARIRILTLQPGIGDDKICCRLQVRRLAEIANHATYETLSYCWGLQEANMSIFLGNEQSKESPFLVRPNLHSALCAFRLQDRPRNLWIDAICINQTDDAEKSNQVPLMRSIYEGAIGTLIWLGKGSSESKPAMNLINSLRNAAIRCGGIVPKIGKFSNNDLAQHGLPPIYSMDYVKLLTMLEQPWFGRAWIVAELPFAIHPAINRLLPIAEEAERYKDGNCRLLSVLLRHRPCQATVAIDKVYAFLGLIEKGDSNFIALDINYQQDLTIAYTNVARRIVEHDRSLDILSLPPTPFESTVSGLPTWAPDWNISTGATLRQIFNAETNSLVNNEEIGGRLSNPFCAAGKTLFSPKNDPSSNVLTVEGQKFDNIMMVHDVYRGLFMPTSIMDIGRSAVSFFQTRSVIMQWEDSVGLPFANGLTETYINGEPLSDAFFQTLMIGNTSPTENFRALRSDYLAWSKGQRPLSILSKLKLGFLQTPIAAAHTLTNSAVMKDPPSSFQKRISHIIFRRLVRTQQGYLGLAAGKVEVGDQIWLLKGSKVPVILKACNRGAGWKVVGDAYVHGIMYGEGFDEGKCGLIKLY